jgi:hypothetical protein
VTAATVLRAATAVTAAALALTACGVRTDDSPRALTASTTTTTTTPGPGAGGADAFLYFVREGSLVPVRRGLPDDSVQTVLPALVQSTKPEEDAAGISTSVPTGTDVLGLQPDGGVLRVDLSDAFDGVVGPSRQIAIGQIVLTATDRGQANRLRFAVDGRSIQVPTPTRGDTAVVTACDFARLLPSPDQFGRAPAAIALERLRERRAELDRTCGASIDRS